uniref:Secreted protein n=1 Tax=Streptomyces sp. NBC_01401 TaxID=2903854 RepID=A0AAU3GLF3_9ACTN
MRTTRRNTLRRGCVGALLAAVTLLTSAGAAVADDDPSDDPSASASPADGESSGPTEAGTTFRTATSMRQDQTATAEASTGDYLYWAFPADSGQRPTVRAKVNLPKSDARHGASTWQVDVYDGLRRRQSCMYGHQARIASPGAGTVELSCVLRTVRAWSEPWASDPLPGTYYIRLTVVDLAEEDLGLPVTVETEVTSADQGGAHDVDGSLAEPLVPGVSAASAQGAAAPAGSEPEDGWSSGWWTSRWLWTVGGGVLAALAAVFGHSLTRGRGRPSHVPSGHVGH